MDDIKGHEYYLFYSTSEKLLKILSKSQKQKQNGSNVNEMIPKQFVCWQGTRVTSKVTLVRSQERDDITKKSHHEGSIKRTQECFIVIRKMSSQCCLLRFPVTGDEKSSTFSCYEMETFTFPNSIIVFGSMDLLILYSCIAPAQCDDEVIARYVVYTNILFLYTTTTNPSSVSSCPI